MIRLLIILTLLCLLMWGLAVWWQEDHSLLYPCERRPVLTWDDKRAEPTTRWVCKEAP